MANIAYGRIDTEGQYIDLAEALGIAFEVNGKYQIQIQNTAVLCVSNTKPTNEGFVIFDNQPFGYIHTGGTLWIKTMYESAVVNIDKSESGGSAEINNQDVTFTENGVYNASQGYTGFGEVTVDVPNPSTGTLSITSNGVYNVTNYASADVNVSGGGTDMSKDILEGTLTGSVTLSSSVTKLKSYALADNPAMTSLTAPNVTGMGTFVLNNCPNLESISLPNYVGLTLNETTGELTSASGFSNPYDECSNALNSSMAVTTFSAPNMTIIPYQLFNSVTPTTLTTGTIIGVADGNSNYINTNNIDPFALKYLGTSLNSISNTYFDYTNIDNYAVQGALTFSNLIRGENVFQFITIPQTSTIDKIELPSLKACNSNIFAFSTVEKDFTIDLPAITSIANTTESLFNWVCNNDTTSHISVDLSNCTTIAGSLINWSKLKNVDLSGCTSITGNSTFNWSTIDYIDLSACTTISGYDTFGNCTITRVDLSACTDFGTNNALGSATITDLILGGTTVASCTGSAGNITNIYVPDTLVSAYEADSYWSQYTAGTIKPLSSLT